MSEIDPIKLKAAAEHLETALRHYSDRMDVQRMRTRLSALIKDATEGRISTPLGSAQDMPFRWAVCAEGLFRDLKNPDVEGAYVNFVVELEGGLTAQEQQIIADLEARRTARILPADE